MPVTILCKEYCDRFEHWNWSDFVFVLCYNLILHVIFPWYQTSPPQCKQSFIKFLAFITHRSQHLILTHVPTYTHTGQSKNQIPSEHVFCKYIKIHFSYDTAVKKSICLDLAILRLNSRKETKISNTIFLLYLIGITWHTIITIYLNIFFTE